MFHKFTQEAKFAMVMAKDECRRKNQRMISTEHILLGIIQDSRSLAAGILQNLGATTDSIRTKTELKQGIEGNVHSLNTFGFLPFDEIAKRALELAAKEAQQMRDDYIGTEHLLLGLTLMYESVAAQVLVSFGVTQETVRKELQRLRLKGEGPKTGASADSGIQRSWQAVILKRSDCLLVYSVSGGVPVNPLRLLRDASPKTIGSSVSSALQFSRDHREDSPARMDWQKPFLNAVGVETYEEVFRGSTCCVVFATPNYMQILPFRDVGRDKPFSMFGFPVELAHGATPSELGLAIQSTLSSPK